MNKISNLIQEVWLKRTEFRERARHMWSSPHILKEVLYKPWVRKVFLGDYIGLWGSEGSSTVGMSATLYKKTKNICGVLQRQGIIEQEEAYIWPKITCTTNRQKVCGASTGVDISSEHLRGG